MMVETSSEKNCTKKRFGWLKRLSLVVFVLLLTLAAAWTIWFLTARAQYQAALDDIRQRGEPVTFAELFPTTLPDDQNAVVSFRETVEAYNNDVVPLMESLEEQLYNDGWAIDEKTIVFDDLHRQPELRKHYQTQLQAILKADDVMLAKFGEMQQKKSFAWKIHSCKELLQTDLFIQCLRMTKYFRICLQIAHDEGNDALALQYYGLLQNLQNAIVSRSMLLSFLFNRGVHLRGIEMLEDIAPSLHIGDEPGAASRKQVQSLIHSLLDDTFFQEHFREAYRGECVFDIAYLQDMIDLKLDPIFANFYHKAYTTPVLSTLCLPILYSDTARLLDNMKEQVYEPYVIHVSDISKGSHGFSDQFVSLEKKPFFQPMSCNLRNSWSHVKSMYLHLLTRRRMAAVALAMRLYEVDHGQWPVNLENLVPKYLLAVPDDPFLPAGTGKIGYLPSAKPPRLYSVGDNQKDEQGEYETEPGYPDMYNLREKDIVFFLKNKPAPPKAVQFFEPQNSVEDSASSSDDE